MRDTKLNYDDITIVPDVVTDIESRKKDCNPYLEDGMLPIWAAPMDTVISLNNWKTFYDNRINVIIPRTVEFSDRIRILIESAKRGKRTPFVGFSLEEAKTLMKLYVLQGFSEFIPDGRSIRVCIDMANGHMKSCIDTVKSLKDHFGDKITIMAGNVANPDTYKLYNDAGCDFVRVGIGGGSACFVAGTKITMADGTTENIEDVNVGDHVMTLNGNKKIINTFSKDVRKTVVINDEIESTLDHKYLVLRKKDVRLDMSDDEIKSLSFYIEAEKLTSEYVLVSD